MDAGVSRGGVARSVRRMNVESRLLGLIVPLQLKTKMHRRTMKRKKERLTVSILAELNDMIWRIEHVPPNYTHQIKSKKTQQARKENANLTNHPPGSKQPTHRYPSPSTARSSSSVQNRTDSAHTLPVNWQITALLDQLSFKYIERIPNEREGIVLSLTSWMCWRSEAWSKIEAKKCWECDSTPVATNNDKSSKVIK